MNQVSHSAAMLASLVVAVFSGMPGRAAAAQKSFSVFQQPGSETVPGNVATNFTVTLTYSNASGTINNAVFTNGISVTPAGQGVTATLNLYSPAVALGSTGTLPLGISATPSAPAGAYSVVVWSTNLAFTANVPIPGVTSVTNTFFVGPPVNSNAFSLGLSPSAASLATGITTNLNSAVTLVDYSLTIAGVITNGVTVSGPDLSNVIASLDTPYAALSTNFGQTNLTLTVSVNSNAAAGIYTITANGTNSAFASNPTPGIATATYTLTLTNSVVAKASLPVIQGLGMSDTTLMITGSNGTPYVQFVVFASTNLTLPLAQWTPVVTNAFDGSGNFNASFGLTDTSSSNAAQQFFTLLQGTNFVPAVATPMFSPPAAPYSSEQSVTISSADSGASIRYTTDGTTPSSTNGTLYTGPVAILGPVVTNLSGTFSNASGVTMLKAVAYKTGKPESLVFTGNYQIMVPPPDVSPSPVRGIAHLAYRVTSLAAARHFWEAYLGFAEPFLLPNSNTVAIIKINDQQYVELYQGVVGPPQYQIVNYGYQVSDAEAYRQQLAAAEVSVPANVTTNALGNISFFSTDNDGHGVEWVQYRTNSLTGQTQGQAMPGTQVFGYIISTGGFCAGYSEADAFYITQCGFLPNGTSGTNSHLINIPNSDGFYENGTYSTLNQQVAGTKSQVDLLNFRGMTIQQSVAILTNRDPSIVIDLHLTTKGRFVGNVYDPDGTRVELDDE